MKATTSTPYEVVFVVEPFDGEQYGAALSTGATVVFNRAEPSYSNAMQAAFDNNDHDLFLYANDDFEFTPDWDLYALQAMRENPGVMVVGINDGAPNTQCATIALVRRAYIEERSGVVDMPRRVFYPYRHNYVDTEFYETAVARGVFVACFESVVKHRHPDWGFVQSDATYERSRSLIGEDAETFNGRRHLWATERTATIS